MISNRLPQVDASAQRYRFNAGLHFAVVFHITSCAWLMFADSLRGEMNMLPWVAAASGL